MKPILLSLLLAAQSYAAQTLIVDTLYDAAGRKANCTIFATPNQTWVSAQGRVIRPDPIFITVTNGALSTSLEDNTTSIPSGTSYNALYQCGSSFTKVWVVPSGGGPVGLAAIESNSLIGASSLISLSQLQGLLIAYTNTANVYTGNFLQDFTQDKIKFPQSTVASLPSASGTGNKDLIYEVTDGISSSDCTVGLSSTQSLCISNGTVWVALGGGGGGGVSASTIQSGSLISATGSSGSGTTYTATTSPSLGSYTSHMRISWTPDVNCTAGAVTLNINGLGAKSVFEADGATNPVAADCTGGRQVNLAYDGTAWRIVGGGQIGGGGTPPAFPTVTISSNILTVGANCPCILKNGSVLHTQGSATISSPVGSGNVSIYQDDAGLLSAGYNNTTLTGLTVSGITAVPSITATPVTAIPIKTWHVTTNNFDGSPVANSDGNAAATGPPNFLGTGGITATPSGNTWTIDGSGVSGGSLTLSGFYLVSGSNKYCGATFTLCTPASGLTILNTAGSSTLNSSGGTQVLQAKAVSGINLLLAGQAIAGGNTTLTLALKCSAFPSQANGSTLCGIGFRESSTSKIISLYNIFLNSSSIAGMGATLAYFTNQTTFNAGLSSNNYTRALDGIWWAKLTCSVAGCATGNITIQTSPDGLNWSQGYTEAVGAHFTTAPNQWGIVASSDSTDNDLYVDILSFLVQ